MRFSFQEKVVPLQLSLEGERDPHSRGHAGPEVVHGSALQDCALQRLKHKGALVLLLILVSATVATRAATLDLSWYTIDGGGGTSTGGSFEVVGSIAQPDPGLLIGGTFELQGGYWTGAISDTAIPTDCDRDGDVDLDDYAQFATCLLGPEKGLESGCACYDFDLDGDSDLLDFTLLQLCFSGAQPGNPACDTF